MKTDKIDLGGTEGVRLALGRNGPGNQRSALLAAIIGLCDLKGHLSTLRPWLCLFLGWNSPLTGICMVPSLQLDLLK